jgi:hypothetical protein
MSTVDTSCNLYRSLVDSVLIPVGINYGQLTFLADDLCVFCTDHLWTLCVLCTDLLWTLCAQLMWTLCIICTDLLWTLCVLCTDLLWTLCIHCTDLLWTLCLLSTDLLWTCVHSVQICCGHCMFCTIAYGHSLCSKMNHLWTKSILL